jgi:hypothetical protein
MVCESRAPSVIAFLRFGAFSLDASTFQTGLSETGYVEGQNTAIEYNSRDLLCIANDVIK